MTTDKLSSGTGDLSQTNRTSRFWKRTRIVLRRLRIALLLTLLFLLGSYLYLNVVGLPGFVKRPIVGALRERGVDLDFGNLRLRWHRGIVAEQVMLAQSPREVLTTNRPNTGPEKLSRGKAEFTAREAELNIDPTALLRGRVVVESVALRQGKLSWLDGRTNSPPGPDNISPSESDNLLSIENIEASLKLLPEDQWVIENLQGKFAGAEFHISGNITNATAVRDWEFLKHRESRTAGTFARRLRQTANLIEQLHFSTPPKLHLVINGDARRPENLTARLSFESPDARTPWGQLTNATLSARLLPGTNEAAVLEAELRAMAAATRWGIVDDLRLELKLASLKMPEDVTGTNQLNTGVDRFSKGGPTFQFAGELTLQAASARSLWVSGKSIRFRSDWTQLSNELIPVAGAGELQLADLTTFGASLKQLDIAVSMQRETNVTASAPSLAWWTNLYPYELNWSVRARGAESPKISARSLQFSGNWRAPLLTLNNVECQFRRGGLTADAQLDVLTRAACFQGDSDFDLHILNPLLTKRAAEWLDNYSWTQSPVIHGNGSVILPEWTAKRPDWRGDVQPNLHLAGTLAITNGAYQGVRTDWATTRITYSNMVWELPDLTAQRGDSWARAYLASDDRTRDFWFRIEGELDPAIVKPALKENQQRGLDYVQFRELPRVEGDIWGRWRYHELIGFDGRIWATNFTVRSQEFSRFESAVHYTNQVLECFNPTVWKGSETATAPGVTADFRQMRIFFTNALAHIEPLVIARVIGPKTTEHMTPYHFLEPPTVRVNGYAPLHSNTLDADLRFDVDGTVFQWWKFNLARLGGTAQWQGNSLLLTNVTSDCYGGEAEGWGHFHFHDNDHTELQFDTTFTNVNLHLLMADLLRKTNQLDGALSGTITITNGNSALPETWAGSTRLRLRQGLIWEIPLFGVLSEPLNAIIPGLGLTRASRASMRGAIADGKVETENLEIRAPALRLQYRGSVDFQGRVDAQVEAEPLRDAWVFGPVINLVLKPMTKIFIYKVSGTLADPKTEPLYVPRILLMPLNPLGTLEEIFSPQSKTEPPTTSASDSDGE